MMSSQQLGQWGEHIAAAWFIKQGYHVLFPRSSSHVGYDFIAEKDSSSERIQVKTGAGYRNFYPRVTCKFDLAKFDKLMVIHIDGFARLYPATKAVGDVLFATESSGDGHEFTIQLF